MPALTTPMIPPEGWGRVDRVGAVATIAVGIAIAVAQVTGAIPIAQDASVYYDAQPGSLYVNALVDTGTKGAYMYTPAFADILAPFRALPLRGFAAVWQLLLCVTLAVTIGRWSIVLLAAGMASIVVPFLSPLGAVASEVFLGNVQIMLGFVAVFGVRYPGLWAIALLTKVTPGVGLMWFVARREWHHLAVALAITGAITLASFAFVPGDWGAWVEFLTNQQPSDFPLWTVPISLPIRLAMSAGFIWWGGRTDRPWTLPVAVGWAIPLAYPTMLATMAAGLAYLNVPRSDGWVSRSIRDQGQ